MGMHSAHRRSWTSCRWYVLPRMRKWTCLMMCDARPIRSQRSSTADPHRTPDLEEQHAWYALAEALHVFWIICSLNLRKRWRKQEQNPYGAPSPSCFWHSASACGTEQEMEKCYRGGYLCYETKNELAPTCGSYQACTGSGEVVVLPRSKIAPRTHQEGNCEHYCRDLESQILSCSYSPTRLRSYSSSEKSRSNL